MTDSASGPRPRRLTARGAATKARIIEAADQLMYERGVASTTLADVRASSGTSKSQLYQHFAEKDALVKEVIEARAEALLSQQRRRLTRVESLRGLELWRDELVERNALRNGAYGGYLLAKTARDVRPMRVVLDMAIAQVRAYSTESNSA